MTCIVAVRSNNNMYLGADSAVAQGLGNKNKLVNPKVFRKQDMLIGCAGSLRVAQLIQHSLSIPTHSKGLSDFEYCAKTLVVEMQSCLEQNGIQGLDGDMQSAFIFCYKNHIYQTNTADFSMVEYPADYAAIGSGGRYANGSLHTTIGLDPKIRVRNALQAAAEHDHFVSPPFHCIDFKSKKPYLL